MSFTEFPEFPKLREAASRRIAQIVASVCAPSALKEGMLYALRGGKMLRPYLLTETAREAGRADAGVLDFACALEMLHTASLIHDDLPCIDNDRLRRGKPSNFAQYGESAAVLQGDALINLAYSVLLEATESASELRAARYIARAAGADGMLGGQYEDVRLTGGTATGDELQRIQHDKTAKMFAAALCGGALLAGIEDVTALEADALRLGSAFQIADDLIDAGKGIVDAGKTLGKDVASHKNTYVTLYGLEAARQQLRNLTESANQSDFSIVRAFSAYIADSVV